MAVKHTPTGEVPKGTKGGTTGCGFNTREKPEPLGEYVRKDHMR